MLSYRSVDVLKIIIIDIEARRVYKLKTKKVIKYYNFFEFLPR